MQTINKFNQMTCTPDLGQLINTSGLATASKLNKVNIGIVQEFYPEDLTVEVQIVNKKTIGLNQDGSQLVRDYAPIYAKVCYCNPFITHEIKPGDECILLFADREIESWFINGDINPIAHTRMHDLTDAIALFGIRSMPKMINILADCLNLFYGTSNIALSQDHMNINADIVQVSNLHATNGASGNLIDSNGKKLATVVDGIITEIF